MASLREHLWLYSFDFPLLPTEDENTRIDFDLTAEDLQSSLTEILPAEALVGGIRWSYLMSLKLSYYYFFLLDLYNITLLILII